MATRSPIKRGWTRTLINRESFTMSRADQEKWDKRFAAKPMSAPSAPDFITQVLGQLPTGRVLDLACGDGAAALILAGVAGNRVTAADVSPQALARLKRFASEAEVAVDLVQLDVDSESAVAALAVSQGYELIVMCHFKPSLELLTQLLGMLAMDGQLLLSTFNLEHHRQHGFPKRFCLLPEEFLVTPEGFNCALYQSVERNNRFMDDYRFVKSVC